jgi:hypothetical protein
MKITSILLAASVCLLSACGSSDVPQPPAQQPGMPQPPAPPAPSPLDAFYSAVSALLGGAEDAEPQAVEQHNPTTPDDTEPVAVGS